jgi:hypothetical protein
MHIEPIRLLGGETGRDFLYTTSLEQSGSPLC